MKKPSIPAGSKPTPGWIAAVGEVLDIITGRVTKLKPLPDNASLQDVIRAHNALLERLQE